MADPTPAPKQEQPTPKQVAGEKLKNIALSFSASAPDEHVVFGAGGNKFTLGDLRDLTGTRRQ